MSEFEKWWESLLCSNNQVLKDIAELSWQKALKWILEQYCCEGWDDGSTLETAIKNELLNNQTDNSPD